MVHGALRHSSNSVRHSVRGTNDIDTECADVTHDSVTIQLPQITGIDFHAGAIAVMRDPDLDHSPLQIIPGGNGDAIDTVEAETPSTRSISNIGPNINPNRTANVPISKPNILLTFANKNSPNNIPAAAIATGISEM
jgi:hypothetical protein